jgi:hypothetical protein
MVSFRIHHHVIRNDRRSKLANTHLLHKIQNCRPECEEHAQEEGGHFHKTSLKNRRLEDQQKIKRDEWTWYKSL